MNNKKQMGTDVVAQYQMKFFFVNFSNRLRAWLSYIWINIIQWHCQVILEAGKFSAYLGWCGIRVTTRVNYSEHK